MLGEVGVDEFPWLEGVLMPRFLLSCGGPGLQAGDGCNILCLLRNEGFPSLCLCASLFVVKKFRRLERGFATFRKRDGHSWKDVFLTFDVCTWEERELRFAWCWSLSVVFQSQTL